MGEAIMRRHLALWCGVLLVLLCAVVLAGCAEEPEAQSGAAWSPTSSLFSGDVNVLLLTERLRDQRIYAAVDGGVYRSDDQGATWTPCLDGLSNRLVYALVLDPDRPHVLYAGTRGGRVYRTEDAGDHWTDISEGLDATAIVALAVDPENPDIIHAATPKRIYTRQRPGGLWELRALVADSPITDLILDAVTPAIVYVTTQGGRLYYSTNRGANWNAPVQVGDRLTDVIAVPGQDGALYAIADGKVRKGIDFGREWTYSANYLDQARALDVAINPHDPQHVLVGTTEGVQHSTNARASWNYVTEGLGESPTVRAIAFDPVRPQNIYLAIGPTVYHSNDGGMTWKSRGRIQEGLRASILALEPYPQNPRQLLASAAGGGLYRTLDGGNSWHLLQGLPSAWVTAVDLVPNDPGVLYAGTLQGVPYRSTDGGITWTSSTNGLRGVAIMGLVANPEQSNHVYLGTWGGGVYDTQKWEQGWAALGPEGAPLVRQLIIDTRGNRRNLYALTQSGVYEGRYVNDPNILRWRRFLGPTSALIPDVGDERRLIAVPLAGAEGEPARSEEILFVSIPSVEPGRIRALEVHPSAPEALYALVVGEGVWRSPDLGETWTVLASGLAARDLRVMMMHPASLILYVGTENGIYAWGAP